MLIFILYTIAGILLFRGIYFYVIGILLNVKIRRKYLIRNINEMHRQLSKGIIESEKEYEGIDISNKDLIIISNAKNFKLRGLYRYFISNIMVFYNIELPIGWEIAISLVSLFILTQISKPILNYTIFYNKLDYELGLF